MRFTGFVRRAKNGGVTILARCKTPNQAMYVTLARFAACVLADPAAFGEDAELYIDDATTPAFKFSTTENDWMPV